MSVGAAAASRAERHLVEHLRKAGATTATAASPLPDLRRIEARRLKRFLASRVIHEPSPDRYYLDEARYEIHRRERKRRIAVILTVLVVAAALFVWFTNVK